MTIYFCIAGITTLLAWISEKVKSQKLAWVLLGSVVLIFCFFAAVRDPSVGTDTTYYGYPTYHSALTYDFFTFIGPTVYSGFGFLYKVVTWIASNLLGTFQGFLFVLELCIVLPVVIVGRKTAKGHLALVVALFALYFYPLSFNLIRQSIAMSFLLLAYWGLDRDNLKSYFIWLIIAVLFHTTALSGLLLLGVYWIAKLGCISTAAKVFLFFGFAICIVCAMPLFLNIFTQFFSHFDTYMSGGALYVVGRGLRSVFEFFFVLIGLFILGTAFRARERFARDNFVPRRIEMLVLVALFGVVVNGISLYSIAIGRLAMYFLYFFILLVPSYIELIPGKLEKLFFAAFAIFAFALVSFDTFAITGQCEVVPYVFGSF